MNQLFLYLLLLIAFVNPTAAQIVAGRGIQISIQGVPAEEKGRIDGLYAVSPSGTILLPLLNRELSIGGMTSTQAAAKIQNAYRDAEIYTSATFQVLTSASDEVRQDVVTVSGAVRAPGPKLYTPGMTLLQTVAAGSGATEFGDLRKVMLIRGNNSKIYNLNDNKDRAVLVKPNDTIDIPERSWVPRFGFGGR
jgi:protein involved in polysaccharide export with SLBB domain